MKVFHYEVHRRLPVNHHGYCYYIPDKKITITDGIHGYGFREGVNDIAEMLMEESSIDIGSATYKDLKKLDIDEPTLESIMNKIKRVNILSEELIKDLNNLKRNTF